jgi:hypothetical protein
MSSERADRPGGLSYELKRGAVLSALFVAFVVGFVAGHGPAPLRAQTPSFQVVSLQNQGSLTPETQAFALVSGATQITLPCVPLVATLMVAVNGEVQTAGIDYTLAGTTITFLALDPLDTPAVLVMYWTLAP